MMEYFKQDVGRWIKPGQIVEGNLVSRKDIIKMYFSHMQVRAMFLFRFGSWCQRKRIKGFPRIIQRLISLLYGLEIPMSQEIGGGLYIAHPYGTVIMCNKIGKNCSIVHNVTIGLRNEWDFPRIGDNVFIGAGARVLGGITVGDGVKVGANAVVIDDIPADSTVVGIPAKVVDRK
jgi:serine O-acetyltransferase